MKRSRLSHGTGPGQRGRAAAALALAMLAAPLSAEPVMGPAMRSFDTRRAAGFGDPRPALRAYLRRHRARPGPQHVCVIGYQPGGASTRTAQVHWREGRRLILWEGSDPDRPADLFGWGRRDLHLDRDTVRNEAGIGGSSYLVTRAWADGVVRDCARRGHSYVVRPGV